jgi:hypothetical protein
LGVSRQGEFKNTTQIFLQKVLSKTFPKTSTKNFDVSFSSTFFVLSRFWVFLSDGSSKALQKTFYILQKKSCRKVFLKKSTKNPKPTFSRFFLSRFWAFLDEGSSKTRLKKYRKINLTLVLFRTLTHPPTTGVTDFFFAGPLLVACGLWLVACGLVVGCRCRSLARGAGNVFPNGPPQTFAKSQTQQPTFFSCLFFKVRFRAFLGKGSSKNTINIFLQKVHVENFSRKNRQNF